KSKSIIADTFSEKNVLVTSLRHKNALQDSVNYLRKAVKSIDENLSGEFISVDLRNAESALGEIIGKVTSDDVLNNIFSQFCIGK
ncbi:MAG: tRNA uridine-5-carboxymethylaminomethyl(34) synthesis GTPase MnmE, partial [Melioribacteraceae bacterium]|nr:tRNA uridine-5-carboxymethylaminomethyl(34) synthesis GTPase MnmE [Melioribacteraceae bacterium]